MFAAHLVLTQMPAFAPPPGDCSGALADPAFFSTCATDGGCFRLATPENSTQAGNKFSVGNYYAADLKYCIDHINGTVYAKTSASDGTGYFELDQLGPMTNQCRVSIDATGAKLLSASGLTCGVTSSAAVMGITNFTLTATVTVPVVAPPPDDCSNSTADPAFFSTCATDGGCFRLATPEHYKQAGNDFSVGNYYAADLKYCIDHIKGTVYAKTSASDGTGYFELDQSTTTAQCRVSINATGATLMTASGLTCGVTSSAAVKGITNFTLTAV